jgi:DNA repair and recombination protein RAD54B
VSITDGICFSQRLTPHYASLVGLFYLRRTQEVNKQYLPPKVDYVLFCKPSDMQANLYRSLLSSRFVKRCMERNEGNTHLVFCLSISVLGFTHAFMIYSAVYRCPEETVQFARAAGQRS